ncbi:uncharacterized protein MELLADRAFT_88277 [Melampsora larici-populina 98AG31]|uniref:Uncharacterized protein n=1 Tax=Melampsora larici-populina (strain 98AG31 / pathotype 3-4-7) TaxID=747676 RepID=F4RR81_MELLP|nr:uncharacterized protein MELLADRAFT_88277 [Melampsora larici-populina 98AG31]EGG05196.1 hypothetical protein MELLADRAFT_88277 [Melampsora larici-populina 98AG31]
MRSGKKRTADPTTEPTTDTTVKSASKKARKSKKTTQSASKQSKSNQDNQASPLGDEEESPILTNEQGANNHTRDLNHIQDEQNRLRTEDNQPRTEDNQPRTEARPNPSSNQARSTQSAFTSCFPSLTPLTYEQQLENWTIADLRQAIADQKKNKSHNRTRAHQDIQNLIKIIRIGYEKRMLMAALMGGVSEAVIWDLVNVAPKTVGPNRYSRFLAFGKEALKEKLPPRSDHTGWKTRNQKLSDLWDDMSKDEKIIFEDPYFFALAKLPDWSKQPADTNSCGEEIEEDQAAQVSAPQVHQLSEDERQKYQPLFDKLVDVQKVHTTHGEPTSSDSVSTLQLKSLAAFRKAHHSFAVECQRFHINYYLTAASCDSQDGWSEVACTNAKFADWALDVSKVPEKFKVYVHGLAAAMEIENKKPQPTDARRGLLTRKLNNLMIMPGQKFPKVPDPASKFLEKGWPVQIVRDEAKSTLQGFQLLRGFRGCDDRMKQSWLSDIDNGYFKLQKIPESEMLPRSTKSKKPSKKRPKKSNNKQQSTSSTLNSTATDLNLNKDTTSSLGTADNKKKKHQQKKNKRKRNIDDEEEMETETETDEEGKEEGDSSESTSGTSSDEDSSAEE